MDAKICNGCGVRLDDGGEYFTFQMFHMEKVGVIAESEPVRELCVGCEIEFRPAIDAIDADKRPGKKKKKKR